MTMSIKQSKPKENMILECIINQDKQKGYRRQECNKYHDGDDETHHDDRERQVLRQIVRRGRTIRSM